MNSTVKDDVTEPNPEDNGSNVVIIVAAAVIGLIVVLVLVVVFIIAYFFRNRRMKSTQNQQNVTSQATNAAAYANPVLNNSAEQDNINTVAVNILPARMIPGSVIDPGEHVYRVDVCIPDDGHKFDIHQKEVVLTDAGGLFKVPKERQSKNNVTSTRNDLHRGDRTAAGEQYNGHVNPAFRASIDSDSDERTVSVNPNART